MLELKVYWYMNNQAMNKKDSTEICDVARNELVYPFAPAA